MLMPMRGFASSEDKWRAVAADAYQVHRSGRPILIGTRTIHDSQIVADQLTSIGLTFQLLNGKQDAEEAAIISQAGGRGVITIATNLAGRGTDIKLPDEVKQLGGLHVIVSEPHELERVDRQLIGRCARQGDPGSARAYVSAEDRLIQMHGHWLEDPIRRGSKRGELQLDITKRLKYVQRFVERRRAAARHQLMKTDLARESLLSGIPHNL
jgi:preprotein translocase subunit SecA